MKVRIREERDYVVVEKYITYFYVFGKWVYVESFHGDQTWVRARAYAEKVANPRVEYL